ncbi:MAG: VCBS repeat-containing protein [Chitinophagaceae bacterium]|nr:VCBS repeat-containing protein [Chitinophagaceae bacterium]
MYKKIASFLAMLVLANVVTAQVAFKEILIDSLASGDNKAIVDIDNDGVKDLVLAGTKAAWYKMINGTYVKFKLNDPEVEFTTDMDVADFDNDGDFDLFMADGKDTNNVMWLENPLPANSPTKVFEWKKHIIGTHGNWMHNLGIGDVNMDNRVDVISSGHGATRIWINLGNDKWSEVDISYSGGGAVDVFDMDKDGDQDIVSIKGWVECPKDPLNDKWIFHPIAGLNAETVEAGDIDRDGKPEIIAADSAHKSGKMFLFTSINSPADSIWKKTEIDPNCGTHKIVIDDFNRDGFPDILFGQELKMLGILYQQPGRPGTFKKTIISPTGGHNATAGDVDNDGDLDIISCDFLNHPPLKLFINESKPVSKIKTLNPYSWSYNQITDRHMQTFGLAVGEVTGDNKQDIVSGNYVYENPGKKNAEWKQHLISKDVHAVLTIDVNGDRRDEIIAVDGNINVFLCVGARDAWKVHKIGSVPKASHRIGAQGHIKAQLIPGGNYEIIMTAGKGTYAFKVPAEILSDWPVVHITERTADEAVDVADINGDGKPDVVGTFGDSHEVSWFESSGVFKDDWTMHKVATVDHPKNYLDRIASADFNADKRPDIVITEENQGGPASVILFLNPGKTSGDWPLQVITKQYTTNSMSVADIDKDGDVDIITAEHRGPERLTLWENVGNGKFREYILDHGKESHDGAKLADLDGDGDLDIVSIAWDKYWTIHVWWNNAV